MKCKRVAVSDSVKNSVSETFYELIEITISLLPSVAIHDRDLHVQCRVYACYGAILNVTFYLQYYFHYIVEELKQIDL